MKILITGGAGFIGSALVRYLIQHTEYEVICLDKLTYAGNLLSLESVWKHPRFQFIYADICDSEAIMRSFKDIQPQAVIHLAAESHVDRSIVQPNAFIQTNIVGTYTLLHQCLLYWQQLEADAKAAFRFLHVSTDEVFGDLENSSDKFSEQSSYCPSSPYSASKASSDHLVRAWHRTYGLPAYITNCSNNYGPCQFPEKLIPVLIQNALAGKALPIYGSGQQIRDWLYVDDHVRGLLAVLEKGKVGETYCIGGNNEKTNLEVAHSVCKILNELQPSSDTDITDYVQLIQYVADRPGHDQRYAIDASKMRHQLSWQPKETFLSGLEKTVRWYLNNQSWVRAIQDGSYQKRYALLCEEKTVL